MSDAINLYYKGCRLVAGMRDGRPVGYVRREGRELARFEGGSVLDCADQAQHRIDQMHRLGVVSMGDGAPALAD